MGADGFVIDLSESIRFEVRCHQCSRVVWLDEPERGHEDCVQPDGRLAVNYDIGNYEDR